jgi:hypothetical protein
MNKLLIYILLIFVMFFPSISSAADLIGKPPADEEGIQSWLEEFGQMVSDMAPFTIYGKVVDQYGEAVSNAQVRVGWFYLTLPDLGLSTGEKWVNTDNTGVFSCFILRGDSPSIAEIKKKGYEYIRSSDPTSELGDQAKEEGFKNSDDPFVFKMRKLGPTTYIYHYDGGGEFSSPDEFVIYDIFHRGFDPIDRELTKLGNPERYDLIFDVTKSGDGYTMNILPVQETGSMQIVDQLLYEAPADGYQPEVTINMTAGERRETYLYFTSRDPAVYSRMEMILDADNERLRLRYDTWTNPYGSRNLEYEPDLPNKLRHVLRKEATKALTSGKLPPEPDIPAMIASGEYN